MDTERSAIIVVGGEEYNLMLTTKATKVIAGRYGGLENLGEKLMKSENFEMAIGEIVFDHPSGKPAHSHSQHQAQGSAQGTAH